MLYPTNSRTVADFYEDEWKYRNHIRNHKGTPILRMKKEFSRAVAYLGNYDKARSDGGRELCLNRAAEALLLVMFNLYLV